MLLQDGEVVEENSRRDTEFVSLAQMCPSGSDETPCRLASADSRPLAYAKLGTRAQRMHSPTVTAHDICGPMRRATQQLWQQQSRFPWPMLLVHVPLRFGRNTLPVGFG